MDVRYALRQLRRSPGFTAAAVLTVALGVGANAAMFSVLDSTLLRPLPFPGPERLVTVWKGRIDTPARTNITSLPVFRDWRERSRSFESLALFGSGASGYNLTDGAEPELVLGNRVTASFFTVLGVPPLLGRTLLAEEEDPGRDDVVVLSHALWTRRYGADPSVVGRAIALDGRPHTVVGVMPPRFSFQFWGGRQQLWVPAGWTRNDQGRNANSFIAIGRLRSGVSVAEARAEMDAVGRALAREHSEDVGSTARVVPVSEYGVQELRRALYALLGVVGFVLLIASVNVANLNLARAMVRRSEMALRSALGAGKARIVRQLLTESAVLALLGGVAGLLLAFGATRLLGRLLPDNLRFAPLRPVERIDIDGSVLAFAFGITCLSGLLFGLIPALAWRSDQVNEALKERGRGSGVGGRGRLRYLLVASEMALTLLVLAGAGLMITSVRRLLAVDPGFDPRNMLVMQMALPQDEKYVGPPGHPRFCHDLEESVGRLPGVVSVSSIAHLPLSGGSAGRMLSIEGRPDPGRENTPAADYSVACPNALRTLGIDLLAGRDFEPRDSLEAPGVALINQSFARRFWPGEDAVGKRFRLGGFADVSPWLTVVGVFHDVRHFGLDRDARPGFLRPYAQAAWPDVSIVVRTASASAPLIEPAKKALAAIEPLQPVSDIRTMEEVVGASVSSRRFPMLLLSAFAALALALAGVGIGGVVGYSVAQRRQEIGVRMALGAQGRDVLRLVVGQGLSWTLAGLLVGLSASFGLLRLLRTLLFGVEPSDPRVLAIVTVVLVGMAALASYVPARRATRVNPVEALRSE
ncbi:MAG TPA: ABC transporter permease [Vicinamibacteria bacterium]